MVTRRDIDFSFDASEVPRDWFAGDPFITAHLKSIRPLWLWHGLEESEHKAVAYDVYRAAGGGYLNRVATMALTTAVFFAVALLDQWRRVLFGDEEQLGVLSGQLGRTGKAA